MKAILDRFEGDQAVLTPVGGGKPFTLPKGALPPEASSGHTLELNKNRWMIQTGETEERRKSIAGKARRLYRD